jgi:MarR family transcriptional regulator, organic hydroperoxide resistance regulator
VSADGVYAALEQLFAAQRRLRGRDARVVDGISLAQSRLLRVLARDGALPAGQLATRLGISAASGTQMLDGLESRGLLERRRSENDRRSVTIELTAAGRERAVQAREQHRRLFESALAGLEPDQLEAGVDVLERCAEYLDSL